MVASGLAGAVLPRSVAALYTRALGLVMLRLSGLEVERLLLALRQRSGCRPHGVKEPPGHTAPRRVHPFAAWPCTQARKASTGGRLPCLAG